MMGYVLAVDIGVNPGGWGSTLEILEQLGRGGRWVSVKYYYYIRLCTGI